MFDQIRSLNASRLNTWNSAQTLLDHVAGERRDMTAAEAAEFARYNEAIDDYDLNINALIERREADAQADTLRAAHLSIFPEVTARGRELDPDAQLRAFLRGELSGAMTVDISRVAREKELLRQGAGPAEIRALAWDAGSGSLVVPTTMARTLFEILEAEVAMLRIPTARYNTTAGENMQLPKLTTHAIGSQIAGQGSAFAGGDPAFGRVDLNAYKYGQLTKVANELVTDAAFDLGSFLARDLGRGLGRVLDADLVNGTGTGEPQGIMTAASGGGAGSLTTGGLTTTPTMEHMIGLQYALNDAYRRNAVWLMKDSTAGTLRRLRDGAGGTIGAFLWQPSVIAGQPDLLLGSPTYTDPNIAAMGSNARIAAYFDPQVYAVRQVGPGPVIELDRSRYFDTDEVGVRAKTRAGGACLDTGGVVSSVMNT